MNIYLLDITNAGSTNGVDRYIACLLEELTKTISFNRIYRISFLAGSRKIVRRVKEKEGYTSVQIPLPEKFSTVIGEVYWSNKFNQVLYSRIKSYFKTDELSIVHIHTLNLIDFALEIKKHLPVKIITHLHCIPWKNLYNSDQSQFNRLYNQYYLNRNVSEKFYTGHSEEAAYKLCDKVITCAKCGTLFVRHISNIPEGKIIEVSNGITDLCPEYTESNRPLNTPARLLFVGAVIASKGIFFVLEALRKVIAAGYPVELYIAGNGPDINFDRICREYSDIPVNLLGSIPFEQLQAYYRSCDIGIIGSLQEQNSYVAIEMCMFGMPIVTTAIDGLDEMFTHQVDALKVPVSFDRLSGLKVDTGRMQAEIVELLTSAEKREKLSKGARRLYKRRFTSTGMTRQIIQIYQSFEQYE